MEKEKTELKQGERKIQIGSNGGGNIGGLVLLGGAFAVGSLVAILATRKGKRPKGSDENRSSWKDKQDQPSQSIQNTFHGNQCCASNGSMEMVSSDNLMPVEDSASAVESSHENSENNDQQIVLSHDLRQDSIDMCDNHCFAEEFQSPEVNSLSFDELDKDAKNDGGTIEAAEEDHIDAVKINTVETTAVEEEKKQAKGSSLLEEIIEVADKEEPSTVKIGAEKENNGTHNFEKKSPLKEMIEVKQEEAMHKVEEEDAIDALKISAVGIPSEQSTGDTDGKSKAEEEPIGVKSCEEIPALNIIEKDGDDASMNAIELKQEPIDEEEEGYAMEHNLSTNDSNDEHGEKRHSIDEKDEWDDDFNKSKNDYGGIQSSSEESAADEILPEATVMEPLQNLPNNMINAQLSDVKTTESNENDKTKNFHHFNSIKNDKIDGFTFINQTRGNFMFSRKGENLEYAVYMVIKASIVVLFLIAMHFLFYLLCNNVVIR